MEMIYAKPVSTVQVLTNSDLKTYIGRDVSRHITILSLNDGKCSERASTELVVHLRCTLKEVRVQVENITGVRFTTWRKMHIQSST